MPATCDTNQKPFLCFYCKEEFTNPIDKPCGHNVCKSCIKEHFTVDIPYQCPVCKTVSNLTPDRGMFRGEMAAHLSQFVQRNTSSSSSEQQVAKAGEVPCDVCTGTKQKALKSCLVCLVSYCKTHLESHLTTPGLKRHQLMEPVKNLESKVCKKHDKLLELFCKNDQMCVCMTCAVYDHRTHDVVPLREEYEGKQAELGETEAELQQMIQERRLKIQQFKQSVELSDKDAEREKAIGVGIFTILKECVEKSQTWFHTTIVEKQRKTKRQAEGFITELQQEIWELEKRSSEVEQLSRSEDYLHLLQNFTTLNAAPPTKNWTGVSIQKPVYEGTVSQAVKHLEDQTQKAEIRIVQQFEVDVTLDPDTASSSLVLSHCQKQVYFSNSSVYRPYKSGRFLTSPCVLANQSFSSGKFYYEVQVKGGTDWDLGVALESISRAGVITLSPQNGFWTLVLRNGNEYLADSVRLCLQSDPEKVGVFVDYEEGLVSFFDVDASALIYSFTGCSFTGKIYPYFSPSCKDSLPMIITPVALGTRGVSLQAQPSLPPRSPYSPISPISPPDLLCNLSLSK